MIGNSSLLAAVLTVVSVMSLSLLSLFCLRCKRKSKVIHEEHQIYNPQTFQREGSMFAVTRSKTVTGANQITPTTAEEFSSAAFDEQSDYQNVEISEHVYVDPLPTSVYDNEETKKRITDACDTPGVYANITKDDDDDYENTEFLEQVKNEKDAQTLTIHPPSFEEEPDYVNQNGES